MCGHESPVGSSFCLNCGSSLASTAYAQTPMQSPGLPAIIVCGACRGENPPGMKFCRSCGSALAAGVPPAMAPTPVYGGGPMAAPIGGGPIGGGPIGGVPMANGPIGPGPIGMMPTGLASPVAPGPAMASPSARAEGTTVACPRCGTQTPIGFAFCQQCGLNLQAFKANEPPARPRGASTPPPIANPQIDPHAGTLAQDGLVAPPAMLGRAAPVPISPAPPAPALQPQALVPPRPAAGPAWGTAVLVNRDGSDGQRFTLAGEYVVIGRTGADIAFDDDRFLARQHARLDRAGDGTVKIHPIDTLNGVFRKADAPVELVDGTTILVGREVLRFERVDPEEVKLHPLIRHGVALFGSPPREPWGRFVQLVPSGGYRDVRHLFGDEIVLGREEGDLVFRDDAFMSRRHAAVTWSGQKAQITDLGSSNGTFVRINAPTVLKHGDQVRMGDQLLRLELSR
jgi:pSer/pThr/pTyr-binding forkhead associated (FHA) protein/ribosomal protein L40E